MRLLHRIVGSAAKPALTNAVAATLASLSLLTHAPTINPAIAAAPPAIMNGVAEKPLKTWGVGNDLKVPDPRFSGGRISDTAGMLDSTATKQIRDEIRQIERDVQGSQVLVVTVADVPEGKSPKQVANELFNYFGIGSMERENSILVLVVRDARRVEIEVGISLDYRFSNAWCTSMLEAQVIPAFKDGRYGDGILRGVEQVGERLRLREDEIARSKAEDDLFFYTFLGGFLFFYGYVIPELEDRNSRACPTCEVTVDKESCSPWETLEPATNVQSGKQSRTYECVACGKRGTFTRLLPKYDNVRTRKDGTVEYYNNPSSSSSGGSSSGRGGGGASW